MYQPSTDFIGRDPMQWWIGQVTDPKKGEWDTSQEKQQGKDGKDVYSHRCRVRIVGYHGNDAELPDKDYHLHMFFYRLAFQPLLVVVKQ